MAILVLSIIQGLPEVRLRRQNIKREKYISTTVDAPTRSRVERTSSPHAGQHFSHTLQSSHAISVAACARHPRTTVKSVELSTSRGCSSAASPACTPRGPHPHNYLANLAIRLVQCTEHQRFWKCQSSRLRADARHTGVAQLSSDLARNNGCGPPAMRAAAGEEVDASGAGTCTGAARRARVRNAVRGGARRAKDGQERRQNSHDPAFRRGSAKHGTELVEGFSFTVCVAPVAVERINVLLGLGDSCREEEQETRNYGGTRSELIRSSYYNSRNDRTANVRSEETRKERRWTSKEKSKTRRWWPALS
ncbi:hypothetical protein C8J57DRAFT_1232342 [Mycena rebaudengoi]|nr:hypothetical protein C8J57DRAFT_1232342 [Mycena rebaudengoi]